ncbi:hypothetical protein PG991_011840 [Apiospora marii]|uniref:Uncharacterized protein n=1 Tax=Apiospora marii TaxID=335849 RepID=A0ABR1RGB6_9PEZI
MHFNGYHVGVLRDLLPSNCRREKNFDPRETPTSFLLRGACFGAAFEAVMAILRDAAPISTDELRGVCPQS